MRKNFPDFLVSWSPTLIPIGATEVFYVSRMSPTHLPCLREPLTDLVLPKLATTMDIYRMDIRRRMRPKPWMSKKRGRNSRSLETGKIRVPFMGYTTDSRYHSAEWRATRSSVLSRDPVCVWCLEMSILTPSNEADHVKASRRLDHVEFYDQSNIVGSCRSCNSTRAGYEAQGNAFDTFDEWVQFLKKKNNETRT